MNSPIIPRHPLDHPGVMKIALGQAASDALDELGDFQLVLVAKADCTAPPQAHGRRILICRSVTREVADGMFKIANGSHRAIKIKTKELNSTPALTRAEIRNA